MPEYLSPGVYVEEVATGPRPIEGVGTSTAGFTGVTERGPLTPRLVTSWQDYYRWFGGYVDDLGLNTNDFYLPYAVRGFFDNDGQRLFIARVTGPGALTALGTITGDNGDITVRANGPGEWGNNVLVKVAAANKSPLGKTFFRIIVMYYRDSNEILDSFIDPTDPANAKDRAKIEPTVIEDFDNLSPVPTDLNFGQSIVNAQSRFIRLTFPLPPATSNPVVTPPNQPVRLQGGTHENPTLVEYLDANQNDINERKGLAGLAAIDEVALLSAPGEVVVGGLTDEVVLQCERLRDRFAILNLVQNVNGGDPAGINPPLDSTYGAVYHPWIRVLAPHSLEGHILVPPSGHVCGICARTDVSRGVHKAPANEVVRGMLSRDLPINNKALRFIVDKGQQDILNLKGVNVIRDFRKDRRGIRVWGARTMSPDSQWRYVNVRRLFIFVEESIDQGTQWAVFEPNYEPTWQAIRLSISAFLRSVWLSGALAGTTQDEAFFVKCDRTTMTQDDIDNGRLICQIGIAPVKPAEFVIFRISQKTLEAQA